MREKPSHPAGLPRALVDKPLASVENVPKPSGRKKVKQIKPNGYRVICVIILAACLAFCAAGPAAAELASIEPGLYRPASGQATCLLEPQADGSWEMQLWQGDSPRPQENGFAFLGRLVSKPGSNRLAGTWLSLPGSCCPGRGRGDIEVLASDRFRFVSFAPVLGEPSWSPAGETEFIKDSDPALTPPASRLAGKWRLTLWYTDLLRQDEPADTVRGELDVQLDQGSAKGVWKGRPAPVSIQPGQGEATLSYEDREAGYSLEAVVREEAGGLAMSGPFRSTLGQGKMVLVRWGLPANPPGGSAAGGGDLSGIWVDPRTGNDFFQIKGSRQAFSFTAYGGALARPRYLSRGRARADGSGSLSGKSQDAQGYCCGNQGRLSFRPMDDETMEVRAFWWPKGRTDPGNPPSQPYVVKRIKKSASAGSRVSAGRWPLVQRRASGLMNAQAGAVRASFTYIPPQPGRICTLFSQGGYRRDMDLFIDATGRLSAVMATSQGPVTVASGQTVSPDKPHAAWLVYQAGDRVSLYLDGELAGSSPLPQPWVGSESPYLVGGSRWPGRAFSGDIDRVELFASAQNPQQPGEPDMVITPSPAAAAPQPAEAGGQRLLRLMRLWHPGRQVHAYASAEDELKRLEADGFVNQGPIAGLLSGMPEGAVELMAYGHRGQGYTILTTAKQTPPGADALGSLGAVWAEAQDGAAPLYQLEATFRQPLKGGRNQDMLYTASADSVRAARQAGYGEPQVICHIQPVKEAAFKPPVLYTWPGSWRGEGWGRFHMLRQGSELFMFWYYSHLNGPHYFGRYRLSQDGRRAQGYAVGRPGPKATYYHHTLIFQSGNAQGPAIRLISRRLAAPMDDGRLVAFKDPKSTVTMLRKASQAIRQTENGLLQKAMAGPSPEAQFEQALQKAKAGGRLMER